ncbi:MAG: nucleotidyltransferase domain-containing protein [Candidatus Thorarchaeota archaeon]
MPQEEISPERFSRAIKELVQDDSVIACYLYGSYARGEETPLSDLDFAILWEEEGSLEARKRNLLRLSQKLSRRFNLDVDVRSLNEASLELQYRVVCEGKVVFCNDKSRRLEFEDRVVMEFLDFKPMIAVYNQYMHKRIEETGKL